MRHPPLPEGIFKPRPTAIETRQDATTKAARTIIDNEDAARAEKTERLKQARLAKEASDTTGPGTRKQATRRKRA